LTSNLSYAISFELKTGEKDNITEVTFFERIYKLSPVFVQNIAVSTYGYMIRRQRYGGESKKYISELEKSQWFSLKKLKEIQINRLKDMIEHAYINVPYYQELFNRLKILPEHIQTIEDLKRLIVIDKYIIKRHSEKFLATNMNRKRLIPIHTGGTTGTPLTIYLTKKAMRRLFAWSEARVKNWSGAKSGDKLASFLHSGEVLIPINQKRPPFWRWNKAYNQLLFSVFHMSENNLKYYMEKFNRFRPQIVQGYVTAIHTFARYILRHQLQIFSPKAVLLSSETLFEHQKREIEDAFRSRVYNGYSGGECVAFITECERGGLHISPEYGVVELEKLRNGDDRYEIIGTNLFNFAMPLIRYRTGDIVTLSQKKKCPCGRELPLVQSVEGRSDEMVVTPEGNWISPSSLVMAFQTARNTKESQIIQLSRNKIIVKIVKEAGFSKRDLNYILHRLKERVGKNMSIEIEFVDSIERTKAGKFRFVISKSSSDEI